MYLVCDIYDQDHKVCLSIYKYISGNENERKTDDQIQEKAEIIAKDRSKKKHSSCHIRSDKNTNGVWSFKSKDIAAKQSL